MDIGNQINEKPARPFKTVLLVLAVVIVLVLVWLWFSRPKSKMDEETAPPIPESQEQVTEDAAAGDSTPSILNELEGIDVNDLQGEFKDIDADLNKL